MNLIGNLIFLPSLFIAGKLAVETIYDVPKSIDQILKDLHAYNSNH